MFRKCFHSLHSSMCKMIDRNTWGIVLHCLVTVLIQNVPRSDARMNYKSYSGASGRHVCIAFKNTVKLKFYNTKCILGIHNNKAGYTANTSRGLMGRGGNACFPLFDSSVTDRPTNQPTNRPTDGRTDKASYRVACPRLKKHTIMRR